MERVVLTVNNAWTKFQGPDMAARHLYDELSYFIPSAVHSKKFKTKDKDGNRLWDGKKRFYHNKWNSFPTGLLERARMALGQFEVNVIDKRKAPKPTAFILPEGHTLRDYQREVVKKAVRQERGIIKVATGGGKTLMAANIIAAIGVNTVFFSLTKDLLHQARAAFAAVLDQEIGIIGDGDRIIKPVTVATVQSWQQDATFDMTFFDECHHVAADTCYKTMQALKSHYRFGLSATPYRDDGKDLEIEAALGHTIASINASDLIDMGYLVPPTITILETPLAEVKRHKEGKRKNKKIEKWENTYDSQIVYNEPRHEFISDLVRSLETSRDAILVLVQRLEHGERLASLIPGSVFLSGQDSAKKRGEALQGVHKGEIKTLLATSLADEGLDLPIVDTLVLAGGGQSETRCLQRVGRALRPYPGKKDALVIDFYDDQDYLRDHAKKRIRIYETERNFTVEGR